jgi:hypothetical protein
MSENDVKKWREVKEIAKSALQHRINLWEEIATAIERKPVYSI